MSRFCALGMGLVFVAGCQAATSSKAPLARASKKPALSASPKTGTEPAIAQLATRLVPQAGQKVSLSGRISLIAQPGAPLLSDQGGSLISNNGGTLLSDQGGSLLSDQGGSLISNNGGNLLGNNGAALVGKAKLVLGLQQTAPAPLGVYGLTDAQITLHDASGKLLVDEKGQPLTATSGPDANYALSAVLPPGNLVAKIKLWNGGELQALITPEGRNSFTLAINTSTTLGAAYVLNKFVSGEQAILDKLPASENARLSQELDVIRAYAKGAFKHDSTLLNAVTEGLRTREPRVDRVIEDVKALLLGQAALGRGLQATDVPLAGPLSVTWLRDGRLALGEGLMGRLRALNPDGTLETVVDQTHGRIKYNVPGLTGMVEGSDGTMYLAAAIGNRVFRASAEGVAEAWLGTGLPGRDAPGDPLAMACTPRELALAPDGTLWVGEEERKKLTPPRLLAVRPNRTVEAFALPPEAVGGIYALALAQDETLFVLMHEEFKTGSLWRFQKGAFTRVASELGTQLHSGLCISPEGALYLTESNKRRLMKLGPNGLEEAHRFKTGPQMPGSLTAGPDGSLYVSDLNTNVVWKGKPAGEWTPVAGTQAVFQQGDTQAFAINNPVSVTTDDQNRIYIAEKGGNSVKRFNGRELEVLVGAEPTDAPHLGDGGPAAQARLEQPGGIAWHQGQLYILDAGQRRLRRVDGAGTIQTLFFGGQITDTWGLALDTSGHPCWPRPTRSVVTRLKPDGQIENLAGVEISGWLADKMTGVLAPHSPSDPSKLTLGSPFGAALSPAGELYFTDAIGCRIYKLKGPAGGPHTVEVVAGIPLAQILARASELKGRTSLAAEEGADAKDVVLSIPLGLAFDPAGNLYVTEGGDRNMEAMAPLLGGMLPIDPALLPGLPPRVRRITPQGIITTIAGPEGKFFKSTNGEDALYIPMGITVTPDGRLVFTDVGANLVRILPAGSY